MIDRIFNLTLTFAILLGSTLAIGSDLLSNRTNAAQASAVTVLPRVVVTGSVVAPATVAQAGNQSGHFVQ